MDDHFSDDTNAAARAQREMMMKASADRRGKDRRAINAPAFLVVDRVGQVLACQMINMSDTGALLEVKESARVGDDFPFAIDDRCLLFIIEADRSQVVDIEVVRIVSPAMGVKFRGSFSTIELDAADV